MIVLGIDRGCVFCPFSRYQDALQHPLRQVKGKHPAIPPVSFDSVPLLLRQQARRRHGARHSPARHRVIQPVSKITGLIDHRDVSRRDGPGSEVCDARWRRMHAGQRWDQAHHCLQRYRNATSPRLSRSRSVPEPSEVPWCVFARNP